MTKQREHWGSQLGFILAAAGSAIGLGSLWKFPYVVGQNGGGAFVLLYIIATFVICFPLFIGELIIGRAAQRAPVGSFSTLSGNSKNWRIVGWLGVMSTLIVFSYYAVVAGWTINYVLLSLTQFTAGKSDQQIIDVFNVMLDSGDVNLLWQVVFLILTAGVVWAGVRKGVEYWTHILTPLLIVLLAGLFLYSMTLPGFGQAIHFIFYPDWSALTPEGILTALGLAFFTASLGFGLIITYGSYLRPGDNIPKIAAIVLVMTVLISLFAAMMIFPIIFTFGFAPAEGPGLVFKTLPILFNQLPGTLLISTIFFALLLFTALTSTVSLLENLVATAMETFNWPRHRSVWLCTAVVFVVGIPSAVAGAGWLFPQWSEMYGGDFFDTISTTWDRWFLPLAGLFTSIFIGWRMDKALRQKEVLAGNNWRWFFHIWLFLVRYIIPVAILIFILEATGVISLQ